MSDHGPENVRNNPAQFPDALGIPRIVTAAATLEPDDTLVHVTLPADSSYIITLPSNGAAKGRKYRILVTAAADGSPGTVSVADQDDSVASASNYTSSNLTAVGDGVIVEGTGQLFAELWERTT